MPNASAAQDIVFDEAARRYAGALISLASEAKSLKSVEKDIKTLKAAFSASSELGASLSSPVVSDAEKSGILAAIGKKAKFGKLAAGFIGTAAENGRAGELPAMISAFESLLAAQRGTQHASITSAKKLTAAELSTIKAQLKKSVGKAVTVDTKIDPALLGGFTVKIGSQYFDSSLRTKLDGLKMAMKEV